MLVSGGRRRRLARTSDVHFHHPNMAGGAGVAGYGLIITGNLVISERLRESAKPAHLQLILEFLEPTGSCRTGGKQTSSLRQLV
jgi:hypothetical protein